MECFSKEIIFWFFCFGVPMFMAYNGGATAATVDTIQKVGGWSPTGIGLLGAMDKIGITMSAGIWGYVLQHVPSKVLLSAGLLVNAVSVAVFAVTQNGYLMYTTKMLIGFTEGLQWVWAPLWVARWADEEKLPLWINLSGCVAAGVGNGVGMLLAGSSTANGLPYAFPFQVEAAVLLLLLLLMVMVPAEKMAITSCLKVGQVKNEIMDSDRKIRTYSDDLMNLSIDHPPSRQSSEARARPRIRSGSFLHPVMVAEDMSIRQQLEELYSNKLYCRSAMAFASSNYVNAGLAFIWIRLFIELWTMEKQLSVVSYLLLTGVGGALGICHSSGIEGSHDPRLTLAYLRKAMCYSCLGAVMTMIGLSLQLIHGDIRHIFLILTWFGVVLLCMGIASTTGLIQIVCNNSVEDEKVRSFGVGLAQGINNFFGNCFGPLLPQMVMDLLIAAFHLNEKQALFSGAVSVVCIAFAVLGYVMAALRAVEHGQPAAPIEAQRMQVVPEDAADQQPLLHPWCCNY